MLTDLRFVFRQLAKAPGFTATVIVTLALGIAATTAIFSVVHAVLLRPLPYSDADQLVRLSEHHPGATAPFRGVWLSNLTYFSWHGAARTIGPIAVYGRGTSTVGDTDPQRLPGASASPELFEVLRVQPLRGNEGNRVCHAPTIGLW